MNARMLRLRAALDRWFAVVIVVLLLGAAGGAWVTYASSVAPGTHQEQRTVDEWYLEGWFSHRATVTGAASETPFVSGTTVEERDAYFLRVMPVLDGELHVEYGGGDEPIDLSVHRRLIVQSVASVSGGEEPTVFWEKTTLLGTIETTARPNEAAAVPYRVNVTEAIQDARTVNERLGSPGRIQMAVQMTVTATRASDDAPSRLAFRLPIETDSTVYRAPSEPRTETFARTKTVTVPNDPGSTSEYGGPVLLFAGLGGVAGLGIARSRGAFRVSSAEREWLAYRNDRADFDEWIATIRLPEAVKTYPIAEAAALSDLVDFAIDTNNGVLESPDCGTYHVVHDGCLYRFEAPPTPGEDSADSRSKSSGTSPVPGEAEASADADTDATGEPTRTTSDPVSSRVRNGHPPDDETPPVESMTAVPEWPDQGNDD
ncbi:MAG TPA: DUF5305 family protein [Natrialbaceae archaeon]|nr:DUF5305 family protein [Natrialbaceae archaeon]